MQDCLGLHRCRYGAKTKQAIGKRVPSVMPKTKQAIGKRVASIMPIRFLAVVAHTTAAAA